MHVRMDLLTCRFGYVGKGMAKEAGWSTTATSPLHLHGVAPPSPTLLPPLV